jgi:predicted nucleotidyltransferase
MTTPTEALEELRRAARDGRLERLCQRLGLDLVVVFGSAVDRLPDTTPRDLDIAVLPSPGTDLVAVVTALIDLLHLDAVDVLDLASAGVLARARALGDGEPLYESEPGLYAREQFRAVPLAMESGWLTDLELDLLAGA